MSLNDVRLPATVIADLYKNSLIEPGGETIEKTEPPATENETPAAKWKWLGNNKKNILVIVHSPHTTHLPDDELDLLTAMIAACKLSLDDVAIVNLNNHPDASYKELTGFFKSKIVLLFAIEPAAFGLPVNFPHFQLQAFANNSFLFSPSLKELGNDKIIKSKLWVCLKRLFNL
jgi:hypothetical protein